MASRRNKDPDKNMAREHRGRNYETQHRRRKRESDKTPDRERKSPPVLPHRIKKRFDEKSNPEKVSETRESPDPPETLHDNGDNTEHDKKVTILSMTKR